MDLIIDGVKLLGTSGEPEESIIVPDSVRIIGNYAFRECTSLRHIILPGKVERMGAGVFLQCWSLESVTLPVGTTEIGRDMFTGCNSLSGIGIPATVVDIDNLAFSSCRRLGEIIINPERIGVLPPALQPIAAFTYIAEERSSVEPPDTISKIIDEKMGTLLRMAINRDKPATVRYLINAKKFSRVQLADYLALANQLGRTEITAIILKESFNG